MIGGGGIILNPPLRNTAYRVNKPMVLLHAARQDKTFLENELVEFIMGISRAYPRSTIVINRNKSRKLLKLARQVKGLYTPGWVPNGMWNKLLDSSKYYLHFKWFEGFGISTAEAVLRGSVPIVYRSPFNGSWTDIGIHCDPHCSFRSAEEAIEKVRRLEDNPRLFTNLRDDLATKLREELSFDKFCGSLIRIIGKT
jgi:glycosyltransferase involved in cell wall biosynthesis